MKSVAASELDALALTVPFEKNSTEFEETAVFISISKRDDKSMPAPSLHRDTVESSVLYSHHSARNRSTDVEGGNFKSNSEGDGVPAITTPPRNVHRSTAECEICNSSVKKKPNDIVDATIPIDGIRF